MKKKATRDSDDLRPEYSREFFKGMKPNRFASVDLHFKDSALRPAGTQTAKTPKRRPS
jgi:hypothetical protein